MKGSIFAFITSVIISQVLTVSSQDHPCNDYVDKILADLKADKEYFQDPYIIPEKTVEVHKKLLLVNYTGEASIYDGFIYGLASLHRDGDVIVDRKKKTHLKMYLGAGELKMQCSGKVKLMGHGPQVKIEAKIAYVNMKLDVVPTSKDSNPKVSNFNIEDVKGAEVKVKGLGPLNYFLNAYIDIIGKLFKNLVRKSIESRIKTFLDKKLKKYVIPEECISDAYSFGSLVI